MRTRDAPARLLFLLSLCLAGPAAASEPGSSWWNRLEARDLSGAPLPANGKWIVLVFLSPECPLANADVPVLNRLAADFAPSGVAFVGVYADPTLGLATLKRHAAEFRLAFPVVDDRAQRLRRFTGATYTPEVLVYSAAGTLAYRGRIDDRVTDFGPARPAATHEDLRDVLAALTAGRAAPFAERPGFGCAIPEAVKP